MGKTLLEGLGNHLGFYGFRFLQIIDIRFTDFFYF